MRTNRIRRFALLLLAFFVLAISFSVVLGIVHAGHHCANGHCTVCVAYYGAQFVMRIMGIAAVLQGLKLLRERLIGYRFSPFQPIMVAVSPVSLNIRMND